MSYDNNFYNAYEEYLKEPTVRAAHDWIFSIVSTKFSFHNVVDLGCGRSQEFYHFCKPRYYLGVDENIEETEPQFKYSLLKRNYRNHVRWNMIPAFVSLFSCEITAPYTENYIYYNSLFSNNPDIQIGLVSGFYYENKRGQNPIGETGDILSYQTLENIGDCLRVGFTEKRILLPVPSKMFGPDVIEVWKIFERNK